MENNKEEGFKYSYSAKEQKEIQDIRKKYAPKEEDKMAELRRLDASVTKKGTVASLIVGILSVIVMGIGMCCCMLWANNWFFVGIIVGFVGIIGVVLAYPVYSRITKKEREKIAPEILRLTDQLLK